MKIYKTSVKNAGEYLSELTNSSFKLKLDKNFKTVVKDFKPDLIKNNNQIMVLQKNKTGEFPRAMNYFEKVKQNISYESYVTGLKNLVNHIKKDVFKIQK